MIVVARVDAFTDNADGIVEVSVNRGVIIIKEREFGRFHTSEGKETVIWRRFICSRSM